MDEGQFRDLDAERTYAEGRWLVVSVWARRMAYLVIGIHVALSLWDLKAAQENNVFAYVAIRVALRCIIFAAMLRYRFRVDSLPTPRAKEALLLSTLCIYFVAVTLHNDELVYFCVGRPELSLACFGMWPFLEAQLLAAVIFLRLRWRETIKLLIVLTFLYFGTGYFMDLSTFASSYAAASEMLGSLVSFFTFSIMAQWRDA